MTFPNVQLSKDYLWIEILIKLTRGNLKMDKFSFLINKTKPAGEIVNEIMEEFRLAQEKISSLTF
jgi:hypothetical protein